MSTTAYCQMIIAPKLEKLEKEKVIQPDVTPAEMPARPANSKKRQTDCPIAVLNFKTGSNPFPDHQLDEVANAAAVTPFIVVPADELEEFLFNSMPEPASKIEESWQWMKSELTTSSPV